MNSICPTLCTIRGCAFINNKPESGYVVCIDRAQGVLEECCITRSEHMMNSNIRETKNKIKNACYYVENEEEKYPSIGFTIWNEKEGKMKNMKLSEDELFDEGKEKKKEGMPKSVMFSFFLSIMICLIKFVFDRFIRHSTLLKKSKNIV